MSSVTIFEKADSREQTVGPDGPDVTLRYGVVGSEEDWAVRLAVESQIPAYFNRLPIQNYQLTPQGGGCWDVEVKYAQKHHDGADSPTGKGETDGTGGDGKETGEQGKPRSWEFSFDTSGGKHKLMQSYETRSYVASELDRVDMGGQIEVKSSGDGAKAEGVEVQIPAFAFTLKASVKPPLNPAWLQALYRITGSINSARVGINVRGTPLVFEAGELLCEGTNGSVSQEGEWELTLKLVASQNDSTLVIGNITGIIKRGWEYLWVRSEEVVTNNVLVPDPIEVYVERVHPELDFNTVINP